jgi:hypothetical protein
VLAAGVDGPSPAHTPSLGFPGDPGSPFRIESNGYSWEWLGNTQARQFESYTKTVSSLYDSTESDTGWQYFMVSAHTADSLVYFDSPVDSGYSVDNLSPVSPQALAGEQVDPEGGLQLTWDPNTETDLSHYAVYRGQTVDFVPEPANRIAVMTESSLLDGEWTWDSGYMYKVTAFDVHGNESPFAFLDPDEITGTTGRNPRLTTSLAQNVPNPFNPATTIAYTVAAPGPVTLAVYDAGGRLIRVLVDGPRAAGRHSERWNGSNRNGSLVASGVYFIRLESHGQVITRKAVLSR